MLPNVAGQKRRGEGVRDGTELSSRRPLNPRVSENGHSLKLVTTGIKVKLEAAPRAFDLPLSDLSELHARMLPHHFAHLLHMCHFCGQNRIAPNYASALGTGTSGSRFDRAPKRALARDRRAEHEQQQ